MIGSFAVAALLAIVPQGQDEEVRKAIDRGAAYLLAELKAGKIHPRPGWQGDGPLVFLALLHSRALDRDAGAQEKLLEMLQSARFYFNHALGTANASLTAIILAELGVDRALLVDCIQFLIETQGPEGRWEGGVFSDPVPIGSKEKPKRSLVTVTGGEPVGEEGALQLKRETSQYGKDGTAGNSLLPVLAFHAAARQGVRVPKETWEKAYQGVVKRFLEDRKKWADDDGAFFSSTTVDATATLAICRANLGGKPLEDEWVRRGIEIVANGFRVLEGKPPSYVEPTSFYGAYLRAMERLGDITGLDSFGKHEWYPLLAKYLLGLQEKDGSWFLNDARLSRPADTAWCILFLTRAPALRKRETPKRSGMGVLETHTALPGLYFHVILDASGSMEKKVKGGKTKFDVARDAIETLLSKLPDEAAVGLRVYGHRKRAIEEGADEDSELVIPIGKLDRARLSSTLRSLKCRGRTPLTFSLRQAQGDVQAVPGGAEVRVILLTDGIESTRGARPEQAAAELVKTRPETRLSVIGFDVADKSEQQQLRAIAEGARGVYVVALDAASLADNLVKGMRGVGEYVLYDSAQKEIDRGQFGDSRKLPDGKYILVFDYRGKQIRQEIWINADTVTRVVVDLFAEEGK